MPQMAPTWWTTLFIMFIMTLTMFMILTYFFKIYFLKKEKNLKNKFLKMNDWKW